MKLTAAERRKVKRLKHWLVAHSNLIVMLEYPPPRWFAPVEAIEHERMKIWNRLLKADSRPLQIAGRELDAQEMRWACGEY